VYLYLAKYYYAYRSSLLRVTNKQQLLKRIKYQEKL